jgi:hypothetical protein
MENESEKESQRSCMIEHTREKNAERGIDRGLPHYGELVLRALTQSRKVREGVQITDINLCHRQKIFELIKPESQTPQTTIRAATGTALHLYTQKKLKNPDPDRYEVEALVEHKGYIFGRIDLYDKKFNLVVDIKTKVVDNERWEIKPFPSHEQQLMDLMALKNAANGVLVYLLIGSAKSTLEFNYHLSEYELQLQVAKLEKRAGSFLNAKKQNDPALAEHVFFNKKVNWLCHRIDKKTGKGIFCPYYWDCFAMIKEEKERGDEIESIHDEEDLVHASNGDAEEPD